MNTAGKVEWKSTVLILITMTVLGTLLVRYDTTAKMKEATSRPLALAQWSVMLKPNAGMNRPVEEMRTVSKALKKYFEKNGAFAQTVFTCDQECVANYRAPMTEVLWSEQKGPSNEVVIGLDVPPYKEVIAVVDEAAINDATTFGPADSKAAQSFVELAASNVVDQIVAQVRRQNF